MNSIVLFIMGLGFTIGLVLSTANKKSLEAANEVVDENLQKVESAELPDDPLKEDDIANPFKTLK